jgi:predicted flap endonuclease-1-like 5' DNA nuclease
MRLIDIEGIGRAYAAKLRKVGIRSVEGLLKAGAKPKARKEIAKAAGFQARTILEWVNRADLYRVRGIGRQYSDLLEKAGVDTVVELSKRDPKKLFATMGEVNLKKNLVNQMPTKKQVGAWIRHAKRLPRIVRY